MAETDYSQVFEAYERLPPDIKKEFDGFRAKNYTKGSPPPEQMQRDLEAIIAKHQPKRAHKKQSAGATSGGLFSLTPTQSFVSLALIVLALAALSPISAPTTALGYASAATYTAPIYGI